MLEIGFAGTVRNEVEVFSMGVAGKSANTMQGVGIGPTVVQTFLAVIHDLSSSSVEA